MTNSIIIDTTHLCCWAGCNTMTNSLHQLTSHIKETHIGSGKVKKNTNIFQNGKIT